MKSKQEMLNIKLSNHESVINHVIGYYIAVGNQFSPSLDVPIFDYIEQSKYTTIVLVNYLGSMMWVNVRPEVVQLGDKARIFAQNLARKLEQIKIVTFQN